MTETLSKILGGNMRKKALMGLAESIAGSKKIKIDRAEKRPKERLIRRFCETAAELLVGAIVRLRWFHFIWVGFVSFDVGGVHFVRLGSGWFPFRSFGFGIVAVMAGRYRHHFGIVDRF
jgi:hypothetical protein